LLVVTLACSISSPSLPGLDTTQVASTLAAVAATAGGLAPTAEAVLTQAVAPTADALLTQAANSAPTLAAAATNLAPTLQAVGTQVAPTVAAAETSVATVVAGAGTEAPSGTAIDPCSLVTVDEASAIAGVPASAPISAGGTCLYFNPGSTTTGVTLNVIPASQAQVFVGQYVPALKAGGLTLDQATVDKLTQDAGAGDMPAAAADLQALLSGIQAYHIQPVQGIGSAAFWYSNTSTPIPEVALYAAKPGALVVLSLRGTTATQIAAAQPQMETLVKRILNNLPDNFTLVSTP
jgi:hypothetical protein